MRPHLCNGVWILKIFLFHFGRGSVFIIARSEPLLIVSSFSDISIWISYQQEKSQPRVTTLLILPLQSFPLKVLVICVKSGKRCSLWVFSCFLSDYLPPPPCYLWRIRLESRPVKTELEVAWTDKSSSADVSSHLDLIKPISDTGITKKWSAQALIYSITDF